MTSLITRLTRGNPFKKIKKFFTAIKNYSKIRNCSTYAGYFFEGAY